MKKRDKLIAAYSSVALLKFLERLTPEKIQKMRKNLTDRGMKAEESQDWTPPPKEKPATFIRTRTGFVYR